MSVSESTLQKTSNWFRCVGYLSESNLKREDCEIKQKDANGQDTGTVKGERIMGSVAVKTDNGIHTFNVYAQNLTSKGEESKQWKMYCDMLDWNPQIGGDSSVEPTLVNIEGAVSINDYVNQQGEVKSGLRWRVGRANTKASPDEPRGTTLKVTTLIQSIKPEVRQEEETGRLIVTLYGAEANGTCFPITAIVDEDMADAFNDCYEVGMTVPFELELVSRHVGNENTGAAKKFGRAGKVAVNNGFDVQELMLVGGDDEIEEPDELTTEDENGNEVEVKTSWINPKAMARAIKARAQMLEELKNNPPEKKSDGKGNNSLRAKKQAAKDKMKGGMKASHPVNVPFDMDDEEDLF